MREINRSSIKHGRVEEAQFAFERWFHLHYIKGKRNRWNPHIEQSHPFMDHVISQENLEQELSSVLKAMNLDAVHIRRWTRRTRNKMDDYTLYYSESLIPLALEAFRDEMDLLGYQRPSAWK